MSPQVSQPVQYTNAVPDKDTGQRETVAGIVKAVQSATSVNVWRVGGTVEFSVPYVQIGGTAPATGWYAQEIALA